MTTVRCLSAVAALAALSAGAGAADFDAAVKPFLAKHCTECHGPDVQKGDFRIDTLPADFAEPETRAAWKAVLDRVEAGTMPPAKKPRPPAADAKAVAAWVDGQLAAAELKRQKAEGRTGLRRLNRAEYENTIRDLLGVHVDVKDLLPEDAVSHGFDNIGEALNLSPVHLQRYLQAAELALGAATAAGPKPEPQTRKYGYTEGRAAANIGKHWLKRPDGAVVFFSSGTFPSTHLDVFRVAVAGRHTIRITGYAHQSKDAVPFALYLGNFGRGSDTRTHGYYELPPGAPTTVEVSAHLDRGDGLQILPVGLKGFNQFRPKEPDRTDTYTGPGLAVLSVEVTGPVFDQWPPRGHTLLFGDLPVSPPPPPKGKGPLPKAGPPGTVLSANPEADAKRLLPGFLAKAFRRPVTAAQAEPYLKLFTAELKGGAAFQDAMLAAAAAALCSPDFLFLREKPGRLDDHALASRLSYFLWRTMPDDELLGLAAAGKLGDPATLRAQTERLLKHPNAARFAADFTDAWLDLRNIDFTTPDRLLYPEFDALLQHSMVLETRAFFDEVLRSNLPAATFVASDFAMLNGWLARHYGVPGVDGLAVRKVPLAPEHRRGGLLTQGAVLKVSANGTNTSPVVRGVYVLERFLGVVPPPPPPGVPAVEPDIRGAKTIRELLDKHRSVETCAGCHRLIDPPGFALEEFDVIGGRRDRFRIPQGKSAAMKVNGEFVRYLHGPPVDASGELTDGRAFRDFEGFRKLLLADPDRFAACLTEKLVAFGTGKEVGPADKPEVRRVVAESGKRRHAVRDLVHAVVQSDLFREK